MSDAASPAQGAVARLSPDWQHWLRENVARGCSRESMLPLLAGGGFGEALAAAAIAELLPAAGGTAPPAATRPQAAAAHQAPLCAGRPVRVALALDDPQIIVFDNLLSEAECTWLVAQADQRLAPSTVVDDEGGHHVPHAHRSSSGTFFQTGECVQVSSIEARIAALLNWPASHGEGLQILRYAVGGEYRAHFDFFDPAKAGSARHLAQGGQRVGTLVMYLCDVESGGGTRFPTLGLEVQPRRGSAVYFANVNAAGATDPRTLHAGVPVLAGVKYIATKWLRERPFGEQGQPGSPAV